VLSLADVRALLFAALHYKDGALVPFVALSLFSGIRPAELRRISWDDIDLGGRLLTIRGAVAKLRQRRLIELNDNLVSWLMPCRNRAIFQKNFRRDFDAVRRAAGFRGSVWRKKGDEKLKPWLADIFRHTSLSFHLAYHKHEGQTADWGGTSVVMLHKHYKGLVKPHDAQIFWSLTPDNIDADQVIPMPKAAA
jgi:integrase